MHRVLLFYFLCYRQYLLRGVGASVEELSALTSRRVASGKEPLLVEVGVGTLAYFCHAMREDYAVLRVGEGSVFDYSGNCLEVFASHKFPLWVVVLYVLSHVLAEKSTIFFFSFPGLGTFSCTSCM